MIVAKALARDLMAANRCSATGDSGIESPEMLLHFGKHDPSLFLGRPRRRGGGGRMGRTDELEIRN